MMYEVYTLSENTVQMHFKNSVKSTNLIVLLKAVKEVKSTYHMALCILIN